MFSVLFLFVWFNLIDSSIGFSSLMMMNTERNNIKGVFFDVDGTLSDSFKLGFDATQAVLKNNDYKLISESDYHLGTKYTTPERFAWHVTNDPTNIDIGKELGQEFDELYVKLVNLETAALYSGINDMLIETKQNHDVIYSALSNACTDYVKAVLKVNSISNLFPIQLGADNVKKSKPSPDGLLEICNNLNIPPSASIYIGDSPTDGQAAKAAKMKSIGVTWGSHKNISEHFDITVDNINELIQELDKMLKNDIIGISSNDAWTSHIHHKSGCEYWYNSITGDTTWTKPNNLKQIENK